MSRVAITTAADRSEVAAEACRRHGLVPVPLPCIAVERGAEAVIAAVAAAVADADWIVVTSARAVSTMWPEGGMPTTPVAAVGAVTAEAVEAAGGAVTITGESGALDLVEGLGGGSGRIVLPHAAGADPLVVDRLIAAGWEVTSGAVYRAVPTAPADDPVDAAFFASPSAVTGWLTGRSLDQVIVAAIGHTTASALTERGHTPDVISDVPSHERLVAALAAHLRGRITA